MINYGETFQTIFVVSLDGKIRESFVYKKYDVPSDTYVVRKDNEFISLRKVKMLAQHSKDFQVALAAIVAHRMLKFPVKSTSRIYST